MSGIPLIFIVLAAFLASTGYTHIRNQLAELINQQKQNLLVQKQILAELKRRADSNQDAPSGVSGGVDSV